MDTNNYYGALELQERLLPILKAFHAFCLKNDIKYSLDWGSLLGAVRHKGFIPWDDDIDIMVDRENYKRIVKFLKDEKDLVLENQNPRTIWIGRIRWANDDGKTLYPPTIDIIIMDNAPDGKLARKIRVFKALMYQGMLKVYPTFNKGNIIVRLSAIFTYYFGKLFSRETKLRWYDKMAQRSDSKKTRNITSYFEEYSCQGKYYSPDLLDNVIAVPFGDTEAYIVRDYQTCLTIQFGPDYMTPPKESDRKPIHTEKYKKRIEQGIMTIDELKTK